VASCFGTTIKASIAQALSGTKEYSSLLSDLKMAAKDGFVESDASESSFHFSHDKMREAAYGMIDHDSKDQFHFCLGASLLALEDKRDILFDIIEQVNHGVPSLVQDDQKLPIAKLNYEAGSRALRGSNYTSAYTYTSAALMLLPNDSQSKFGLNLRFQHAKASYSCEKISEAR
jgi:predicted ATPase